MVTAETILKKANESLASNVALYDAYGKPVMSDVNTKALRVFVVNEAAITGPNFDDIRKYTFFRR